MINIMTDYNLLFYFWGSIYDVGYFLLYITKYKEQNSIFRILTCNDKIISIIK